MRLLLLDFYLEMQFEYTTYFLVFQQFLGMSIKGTRVRYSDILTLLSIFKSTVNMN